eukprot:1764611-Rhodomonas_salina.1
MRGPDMVAHRPASQTGIRTVSKEHVELSEERNFQKLKQKLTAEGYVENLAFDSVELASRLLEDVLSLRETNSTLTSHLSQKGENEARLQSQIQPVQKELSRMVKENNQLHLELIQRGEELDLFQRKGALHLKKLETEVRDRVFVHSQQSQHIRDLEHQIDEQKERIQQLLEPSFTCTSGTGGGKPKGQEITVSRSPAPPSPEDFPANRTAHSPSEDVSARQIADLEATVAAGKMKIEELSFEISTLQSAIVNREQEISRMGKLLMRNVNSESEELEQELADRKELITRLNSQLDFVSGQLAETEALKMKAKKDAEQIAKLRAREEELSSKLEEAEQEVRDLCSVLKSSTDGPPAMLQTADSLEELLGETQQQLSKTQAQMRAGGAELAAAQAANAELQAEVESLEQRLRMAEKVSQKAFATGEDVIDATRGELGRAKGALAQSEARCDKLEAELAEVRRLKDNLYTVVWDFENQMAEIQTKIAKMAAEREDKAQQVSALEHELAATKDSLAR